MAVPFQLSLELTNILTPLTSTATALGSLALAKAIRQGGSDVLTELELASVLGRNRIDPSILLPFRQIVGKGDRNPLSQFLELILDASPGPTVRNAFQNPELLSMVIQLSALCSVHESDSLAQAIVEAIHRNFTELKHDLAKVPDFLSLCGTLRVCKQDTADFHWEHYFKDVEYRLRAALQNTRQKEPPQEIRAPSPTPDSTQFFADRYSISTRTLPFPVLQVLLLCLHSLQHFPEDAILYIQANKGLTTVIVWCYHILGLSVKLVLLDGEIHFGEAPVNVFVQEITSNCADASLLQRNDAQEPLFRVVGIEGDPFVGPELRKRARGFGKEMINELGVHDEELGPYIEWVMSRSFRISESRMERYHQYIIEAMKADVQHDKIPWLTPELSGLKSENILSAGRFLFDFGATYTWSLEAEENPSIPSSHLTNLSSLSLLVLSLARIRTEDLKSCSDLQLSTQALDWMSLDEPFVEMIAQGRTDVVAVDIVKSFDILSRFIQGPLFSPELNRTSILISSQGWSLYFESVTCSDLAEVLVSKLRLVRGVPARGETRKSRIVDGPNELQFSPSQSKTVSNSWKSSIEFFPGVSKATRGSALIGQHGTDCFQVTQSFEWKYQGSITRKHLIGFREMLDICMHFVLFQSCDCNDAQSSVSTFAEEYLKHQEVSFDTQGSEKRRVLRSLHCLNGEQISTFQNDTSNAEISQRVESSMECIFSALSGLPNNILSESWLFFVSNRPAARWLEAADLIIDWRGVEKNVALLLRGPDTCFRCALKSVTTIGDAPEPKDRIISHVLL